MSRRKEKGDTARRAVPGQKTENRRAVKDGREAVLLALLSHEKDGTFSNVLVKRTLDSCAQMTASERAFIKRLLEGVIERRMWLDAQIERFTNRSVTRLHPVVLQILRMGIYQIHYMDAVPDSAACNEAVRLARRHAPSGLSGFVNGVLRNAAREAAALKAAEDRDREGVRNGTAPSAQNSGDSLKDRHEDESIRQSMPAWLVSMWEEELGQAQTGLLMSALMEIRPVTMRVCGDPSPEEVRELLARLRSAGVQIEKGKWLPRSYYLRKTSDLRRLPGFARGLWTVQDESSMLAVEAAGLQGFETVYDVCAAPGGKSFLAADILRVRGGKDCGQVFSFDLTEKKTERIREGAARLHLSNLTAAARDARTAPLQEEGTADVLLCDLPCSGLGVIGKKRDIKYRASMEGILELQKLQRQILAGAVKYLKKGGTLIYSTCTICRKENEENAGWISRTLGLLPDDLSPYLPAGMPGIQGNTLQLLPHVHGTDGFYIARFRKMS